MHKVSLYIPCFNAEKYLASTIEGVLSQTYPIDEILLIDDGSDDRTVEIASRYLVKIISHGTNRGLAAARNTAFRHAQNELVAALDADCVPRANWLETLLACMGDPQVAGAGGKLIQRHCEKLPDRWRALHMKQHHGEQKIINPPFLAGHGTIFKKSVVMQANLYNEKLKTNAEDVDISERIKRTGCALVYQPQAVSEHQKTDTVFSVIKTYWRYGIFGYWQDVNLWNLAKKIAKRLLYEPLKLFAVDLKERQLDCALLSCLALSYLISEDIRYFLKHRGQQKLFDW